MGFKCFKIGLNYRIKVVETTVNCVFHICFGYKNFLCKPQK